MSESKLNGRRRCAWLLLSLVLTVLSVAPTLAQGGGRVLVAGTTLSDSLGPETGASAYVFDAAANSTASITLSNVNGSALALHVSDINGNMIDPVERCAGRFRCR